MKISVIGLGKLGSPLAAVLASKGHEVVGVDVNGEFASKLDKGIAPVQEPQLQELIDQSRGRLRATTDFESAVVATDATFIIVPTPSDETGAFTNKFILASLEPVGAALRKKSGYHVVNITSTVMPGSCDGEIRAALERHSGRRVGDTVGLCYNPEFIALGSVVRDMLFPDFLLLGTSDSRAGDVIEEVYKRVCEKKPPVHRMNLVNAEITKISVNTYITMKISAANVIADVCGRLPGADADVVTAAMGADSRIGRKYLRGAIGYGGPCFPRDTKAFALMASRLGAQADLAQATDRINQQQILLLTDLVRKHSAPGSKVGILGLSYKPDTAVIEESQGVALASRLSSEGFKVIVYDPLALGESMKKLAGKATAANSAEACVRESDSVVIPTTWPEFATIVQDAFKRQKGRLPVIDCWRTLSPQAYGTVAELIYPGHGRMVK